MGIVTGSILFWTAALLILSAHLLFVELISRDHARRRLPGYVGHVLGKGVEWVAVVCHGLHLTGVNLAYLILGGEFLATLLVGAFPTQTVLTWQILYWVVGALSVFAGLRLLARIESVITWVFLTVLLIIGAAAFTQARAFPSLTLGPTSFAGIGVFLFSLSGLSIIPEVYELTNKRIKMTRAIVVAASLATACLIWLFGVGISIAADGRDLSTVVAIASVLPASVAWLIPVFGLLAVSSSFFITGYDLRAMYRYDLKLPQWATLSLAVGVPLVLLLASSRDFFRTIDIVGSLFNATSVILVSLAAWAVMRREKPGPPMWWRSIVPLVTAACFFLVILQRIFR